MMSVLHRISNVIGNLVIGPWTSMTAALIFSATVLAAAVVGLFRLVGRPQSIRAARNRLLARTLELLLFGHDGRTLLTASGRILVANVVYLWQFIVPVCVTALPVTLLLVQGSAWFAQRPYRVGQPIIVEVRLAPGKSVLDTEVSLNTADCLALTAGPVRIPDRNELCYRLVATKPDDGWVDLRVEGHTIRKQVAVGEQFKRLSNERRSASDWNSMLSPAEEPLVADSPFVRVATDYPQRTWNWGLSEYDACVAGLLLALVFSLIFARIFRVSLV